jgi:hypothetical protein
MKSIRFVAILKTKADVEKWLRPGGKKIKRKIINRGKR